MDKELNEEYISDNTDNIDAVDAIENGDTPTSSYQYLLYIILIIALGIFILWIIISMFSSEPPIVILNQMLNNNLEISSAGD